MNQNNLDVRDKIRWISFVEDIQEEIEEDIDIFFLKVDQDGDFTAIENDGEFDKVSSTFDEIMKED